MGKSSPWFNGKVRKLITERNKAWQLYKRFKRTKHHATYKRLRNWIKTESRNAIAAHYHSKFNSAKNTTEL